MARRCAVLVAVGRVVIWSVAAVTAYQAGSAVIEAALLLPAYVVSYATHEAGHAVVTMALGGKVVGIKVAWYRWHGLPRLAGVAVVLDVPDCWARSPWRHLMITAAGPIIDVGVGISAWMIGWYGLCAFSAVGLWRAASQQGANPAGAEADLSAQGLRVPSGTALALRGSGGDYLNRLAPRSHLR